MYNIRVSPEPGDTCSRILTAIPDGDTSHSCANLEVGSRYTYFVNAVNCGDQTGETFDYSVHPQGIVKKEREREGEGGDYMNMITAVKVWFCFITML